MAPVFGTKLISANSQPAFSVPGVQDVIVLEDSVAVVADNYWYAKKALELIETKWEASENDSVSSADIATRFDRELANSNGNKDKEVGDANAALSSAADYIEERYRVPFNANAAMEPMYCTVQI